MLRPCRCRFDDDGASGRAAATGRAEGQNDGMAHSGSRVIESELGQGTLVTVTIPEFVASQEVL